jgi:hypothetical protein
MHVHYELLEPVRNLLLGFDVYKSDGTQVYRTYDLLSTGLDERQPGRYESVYQLPADVFPSGTHYFDLVIGIHRHGWLTRGDVRLRLNLGGPALSDVHFPGIIAPIGEWRVFAIDDEDELERAL